MFSKYNALQSLGPIFIPLWWKTTLTAMGKQSFMDFCFIRNTEKVCEKKSSFSGTESPGEDATVSSELSWLDQGLGSKSSSPSLLWSCSCGPGPAGIPALPLAKGKAEPFTPGCTWLPSPHSSAVPGLFPSQVTTISVSAH